MRWRVSGNLAPLWVGIPADWRRWLEDTIVTGLKIRQLVLPNYGGWWLEKTHKRIANAAQRPYRAAGASRRVGLNKRMRWRVSGDLAPLWVGIPADWRRRLEDTVVGGSKIR